MYNLLITIANCLLIYNILITKVINNEKILVILHPVLKKPVIYKNYLSDGLKKSS